MQKHGVPDRKSTEELIGNNTIVPECHGVPNGDITKYLMEYYDGNSTECLM